MNKNNALMLNLDLTRIIPEKFVYGAYFNV